MEGFAVLRFGQFAMLIAAAIVMMFCVRLLMDAFGIGNLPPLSDWSPLIIGSLFWFFLSVFLMRRAGGGSGGFHKLVLLTGFVSFVVLVCLVIGRLRGDVTRHARTSVTVPA